ncbi:MAG: type I-G CRISPR-associated RAMP protein Csb1/Cas7g [Bryobacteraceae bacterium]
MTEDARNNDKLSPDAQLLDELLGVAARKPGKAAELPAVVRVIESLEAAGGADFPIFPASYAGVSDNDPPVYDLFGIEYGDVDETIRGKGKTTVQRRQILRAERCAIDSPQSQANRTEVAFDDDAELRSLVPQGIASIPRSDGNPATESLLRLPHRVGDFRVRLSDKQSEVRAAINSFASGDCLPLLRMMPTSVVFGFWDSRGEQGHKHARILLSRIDAFDVVPCRRHALYSGPYSKDEFAAAVLDKATAEKSEGDAMSEKGFTNAPAEGLGGVLVEGRVERLSLISLTDIARLNCRAEGKVDDPLTEAARRYVFALAALGEAYPRSTGSHRLRSGCELINTAPPAIELRGAQFPRAGEFMELYGDRKRLSEVAKHAMILLNIPSEAGTFIVSKEALQKEMKSSALAGMPAADVQPSTKKARKRSK